MSALRASLKAKGKAPVNDAPKAKAAKPAAKPKTRKAG
jgi:hypothetical protein